MKIFQVENNKNTEAQSIWIAENRGLLFKGKSPNSGVFTRWVNGKLKYQKKLSSDGWQGAVQVRLFVEAYGSIKDVEVLKCAHESFAKEAVRGITSSPKWTPGYLEASLSESTMILR